MNNYSILKKEFLFFNTFEKQKSQKKIAMNKHFSIVLVALLFTLTSSATQTIRILAIGNSFSEDAAEAYLDDLANAAGIQVVIGNMYIGGCSLETHWYNASNNLSAYSYRKIANGDTTVLSGKSIAYALADESWDYITFQQVSQYSGKYVTYYPYITNLINYVKSLATNPAVQYCLHRTWAYATNSTHSEYDYYQSNQMIMFDSIVNVTNRVAAEQGISLIIPAGTAIQNGRSSYLGDSFNRDGYHLSLGMGRYTAACAWFEKIFGQSVVGNTFAPASLSQREIDIAQNAAHYAVLKPDSVTSMATPTSTTYGTIQVDFGSTASASPWNNVSSYTQGLIYNGLLDVDSNNSGLQLKITDDFGGINTNGPTGFSSSYTLPGTALSDSFWGNGGVAFGSAIQPTAGIEISGLDINKTYDFSLISSRSGVTDNRETFFSISGTTQLKDSVNSSSNTSNMIEFKNFSPDANGKVTISMRAGANNNQSNKFFYLNAMLITPHTITAGINTLNQNKLSVYPNPVNMEFSIKNLNQIKTVTIKDIFGRTVYNASNSEIKENKFNVQSLANGYYILQTENSATPFLKK